MRLSVALAGALAALCLAAAPAAQASAHPAPKVTSSYTCHKAVDPLNSKNPDGSWHYDRQCDLSVTAAGLVSFRVVTAGARGTTVMFFESQPAEWLNGVQQPQGMGAGHQPETLPYSLTAAVPGGWRYLWTWTVTLPLNQQVPHMYVTSVRR